MAFPLRNRLKKKKDFEEVFAKGSTTRGSFFLCKVLFRHPAPFRCAVVVPSKISRSAAVRNRIRRRVLGVLQDTIPSFSQGWDMVFSITAQPPESSELLIQDIRAGLERARLIL